MTNMHVVCTTSTLYYSVLQGCTGCTSMQCHAFHMRCWVHANILEEIRGDLLVNLDKLEIIRSSSSVAKVLLA